MAVNLTINGTNFLYPEEGDSNWGTQATDWAVAVTNGMLQKAGGNFTLLADVDFGLNFGLISKYYKSNSSNIAQSGILRLANTDVIAWRNSNNTADLTLSLNGNTLQFNGTTLQNEISVSDTATVDLTLTGTNISADIVSGSITDSHIAAAAAIARSKIASGSANHVVINDGSGVLSSEQYLAKSRGGTGADNTAVTFPSSGIIVTEAGSQTLTNKTIDGDDNTVQDLALTSLKTDLPNANKVIRRNASGVVVSDNNLPNSSDLVTVDSTQTLTNKTIDGDDNTVQDLSLTSLKTDVANANKVIRRDASGVVVSGNNLPNSSDIVTIDASQVITNKDIDGGTASNSNRITLPKNTRTNLNALTRKEGTLVYDTDGDKVLYDDGTNLKELGSGGGELNFLQLANASWDGENGTAGFATYKDAAQSRPQDGTGGSPSVTITTSNTTPLSGNNSLIISKPSGNLQGEGVSVNFAIDRASRARVLKIEFDYLVNSGTFNAGTNTADSDLIVYIYDVDANQLIEPSTFKLYANATNIADRFSGYFQTSAASTNYRLIFHVATTNSSAWSLKVDNVVVAPSKYVYGTPITDWVEYTPTFNSGFSVGTGGGVFNKWYWRRVGDSIQVRGSFKFGSSGFSMGSSYFFASLPSGRAFDFTKIPFGFDRIGVFDCFDEGGTNQREVGTIVIDGTSNTFHFAARRISDNISNRVQSNFPFTWGAGDEFFCQLEAPIQGWSSSVKMSDGYDGREIVCRAYRNTDQSVNTNGNSVKVQFSHVEIDTTNSFDVSNNRWICPSAGYYRINANLRLSGSNVLNNFYAVAIRINNSVRSEGISTPFAGSRQDLICNDVFYLKAGDVVEILVFGAGNNSSNAYFLEGGIMRTYVSIFKVQSPQTIAMGEVVAARYRTSSGQSIPIDTYTTVNFNIKDYDTHNAVTTGTNWVFTAPVAGIYNVSFRLLYNFFSVSAPLDMPTALYKNNNYVCEIGRMTVPTGGNVFPSMGGSADIQLNAGDTISIRANNFTGAARNLLSDSSLVWVAIHKIS
jgi:hypothetical protein